MATRSDATVPAWLRDLLERLDEVTDIDRERGQIHVQQGKGRKDRYVLLSPMALGVLQEYARVERPYDWLFPGGHRRDRHLNVRSIQREVVRAAKRAGIQNR